MHYRPPQPKSLVQGATAAAREAIDATNAVAFNASADVIAYPQTATPITASASQKWVRVTQCERLMVGVTMTGTGTVSVYLREAASEVAKVVELEPLSAPPLNTAPSLTDESDVWLLDLEGAWDAAQVVIGGSPTGVKAWIAADFTG